MYLKLKNPLVFFDLETTGINISKDRIRERMAVSPDNAWDVAGPTPPPLPDKKFLPQESKFTLDGRWDVSDVEDKAFKEFRKKHGLK